MTEKLTKKDIRLIAACLLVAVLSLLAIVWLDPIANPPAKIDFELTREQAREQAQLFLNNSEWDVAGFSHGARFHYDESVKEFLERNLPREEADDIFAALNGWRWQNRWFKRGAAEEYRVHLSTSGELAFFERQLAEDAPGDSIDQQVAMSIAEFFLAGQVNWSPQDWRLVDARSERLAHRVDHRFEWEAHDELAGAVERVSVVVQGDEVGRYNRSLELPDEWVRAQRAERFKDFDAPIVVTIVLAVLAILFTVLGARPGQIRWRATAAFGAVLTGLVVLNEVNGYSTNQFLSSADSGPVEDFIGFVFGELIIQGGFVGLIFWLLAAGAEIGYRAMFPRHIAIRYLLSASGIRSRAFMQAIVAGAALALFVTAVATAGQFFEGSMQGWREGRVPDVNDLNTSLPWVGMLMNAFLTTVFLEAVFRMFVVPFAMRKMPVVGAVLLSALMWAGLGLGEPDLKWFHVSVAFVIGLATTLVFVRFGLLATLYGSFAAALLAKAPELLRASDPYLVTTGAVGLALLALPVLYTVVSYVRAGGFGTEMGLTNADDADPPAPPREAAANRYFDGATYAGTRLPLRRVAVGLFVAGVVVFAIAWPRHEPIVQVEIDRATAIGVARTYVTEIGHDVDGYLDAAVTAKVLGSRRGNIDIDDGSRPRYLAEVGGAGALGAIYPDIISPCRWHVRLVMPLDPYEYDVYVDAGSGRIDGHEFTVPDSAAGATLAGGDAEALARGFLAGLGLAANELTLLDSRVIEQSARRDHVMSFRVPVHIDIGEAVAVYNVSIVGDRVGRFAKDVRVPESWKLERDRDPIGQARAVAMGIGIAGLFILWLVTLARALRRSKPNWTPAIIGAVVFVIIKMVATANNWPLFAMRYVTDVSVMAWVRSEFQEGLPGTLISSAFIAVLVLSVTTLCPGWLSAFGRRERRHYATGAFFAVLATVGLVLLEFGAKVFVKAASPASYPILGMEDPEVLGAIPGLALVTGLLEAGLVSALLITIAVFFYQRHLGTRSSLVRVLFLGLLLLLSISPGGIGRAGGVAEAAVGMLTAAGFIAAILVFWRGNPVAYVCGVIVVLLSDKILVAISQPAYATQAFVALAVLALPLVAIAVEAFRGRART